eukprot:1176592-Amphidinium_carterae.1
MPSRCGSLARLVAVDGRARVPYQAEIAHADRIMGFGKFASMKYRDTPVSYRVWAAKELMRNPTPDVEQNTPSGMFANWCLSQPEVKKEVANQETPALDLDQSGNTVVATTSECDLDAIMVDEMAPGFLSRSRQ